MLVHLGEPSETQRGLRRLFQRVGLGLQRLPLSRQRPFFRSQRVTRHSSFADSFDSSASVGPRTPRKMGSAPRRDSKIDAVQNNRVKVHMVVQAATETLHEGHRPRVRCVLSEHPGLLLQRAEYQPRETRMPARRSSLKTLMSRHS